MTALDPVPRVGGSVPTPAPTMPRRWWLGLSVPIAVLGVGGSLTGLLVDRVYAHEADSWKAEAIGQDLANLVVLTAMLVLAALAARGSVKALLGWLGTVVYTAYTFAIYVFAVHFGPLFLLYVAVFAMAVWALVGGLVSIDPARVRAAFETTPLTRFTSAFLVVVAAAFGFLWISEDLPAMVGGTVPQTLTDSGLTTNPVHVLDLSLFLPAAVLAGELLRRGRAWGHVLAPVVLVAMASISLGIVCLTVVHIARGEDGSPLVAAVIGTMGIIQAFTAWRFLGGVARASRVDDVVRQDPS